jgi:hypothetical protein
MTARQFAAVALCSAALATIATSSYAAPGGQRRGGAHGAGRVAGPGRAGPAPSPGVGRAVPRPLPSRPLIGTGHFYRPYTAYPRFGLGFSYGYPYGYYGYPYWGYPYAYGYPGYGYYGYYGYGYPGYGYSGYGYPGGGYAAPTPGGAYGRVRITNAPNGVEVYADGDYVGIADDFDGRLEQLNLEPGPHRIELRAPGFETATFEVNVHPGQTIHYRASMQPAQP